MRPDLGVSRARLETDDDAELVWRVIEHAYDAIEFHEGPVALAADLDALTPGQRALLAVHWCVSQVSNGGFDQFFTSPSGVLADEVVAGLARVEAYAAAAIVQQARAILPERPSEPDPGGPAFDEADAAEAFDAYLARYAPLEERFEALLDTEVYPNAAAYVRRNVAEFVE